MLADLDAILCYIAHLPTLIVIGIIELVNILIIALGGLLIILAALLPTMPTPDGSALTPVLATANWFYPIGAVVTGLGIVLALWVSYLVVKLLLGWLKVIGV